jgi:hypothetical protein
MDLQELEIYRITKPKYGFESPPLHSVSSIKNRFSLHDEGIIYCAGNPKTALREVLQVFYSRKSKDPVLLSPSWRDKHVILKGVVTLCDGDIIDIEAPEYRRELDLYLSDLLDKFSIPHVDTSTLRGSYREVTQAISEWVFNLKKGAGILYRSKYESNGICYALFSSRVRVKLLDSRNLNGDLEELKDICDEFNLSI